MVRLVVAALHRARIPGSPAGIAETARPEETVVADLLAPPRLEAVPVPHFEDRLEGRAAAELLSDEWPNVSWVPEAPSKVWADAAVERFAELIGEQRSIFREADRREQDGAHGT